MTSYSKLNFAVIGCGRLARRQHIPNITESDFGVLHSCCDLDDNALQECREKFGARHTTKDYLEAVNHPEVDAILVATTEHFRIPIIEAAAKAKKPVYVEKPLAARWEDVVRIRDIVKSAGIPFCVGHNRRSSPAMIEGQKIFSEHMRNPQPCPWRLSYEQEEKHKMANLKEQDGVAAMSIRINDDWYSWKAVHLQGQNAEIGLLLAEMTHFSDIACWFLEAEPVEVMTMSCGVLNHNVAIKFSGGQIASILMGSNGSFGYPKELYEVMGKGAVVIVDHMLEVRTAGIAGVPKVKSYGMLDDRYPNVGREGGLHGWLEKQQVAEEEATKAGKQLHDFGARPDKGHHRHLEAFVREIRGERSAVTPIDSVVKATQICFAAIKSAHEKRTVLLNEF